MSSTSVVQIDAEILEGMEPLLSESAGHKISMAAELSYFSREAPIGCFVAQNRYGKNLAFIRHFQRNSTWTSAELYVGMGVEDRKTIARVLLTRFFNENRFHSGHRLHIEFFTSDNDLNPIVEELVFSDRKLIFYYLEISVSSTDANNTTELKMGCTPSEVAQVLSHLHPVSAEEAKSWIQKKSLRFIRSGNVLASVAQISFYPEVVEIKRIATHPEYQRKGFAKKLLSNVCEKFRAQKIKKIFLRVEDTRTAALGFYSNFGFVEDVSKREIWHSKFFS